MKMPNRDMQWLREEADAPTVSDQLTIEGCLNHLPLQKMRDLVLSCVLCNHPVPKALAKAFNKLFYNSIRYNTCDKKALERIRKNGCGQETAPKTCRYCMGTGKAQSTRAQGLSCFICNGKKTLTGFEYTGPTI